MSFDPGNDYAEPSKIVSEGSHLFQVSSCETRKSRSGNHMLDMTLVVVDRSSPVFDKEVRTFYMLTESDSARWFLAQLCRVLDERMRKPGSGFDPFSQASVDDFITGKLFVGSVYHEDDEYQGRTFRVARVSKRDVRPLNDNEIRLLKGQHGGTLPAATTVLDSDDVPF